MTSPALRTGQPLLEVEGLSKTFGKHGWRGSPSAKSGHQALADVTLSVMPGQTVGIVGESGCGKSTLARIIVGLMKPSQGRVKFDGQDLGQISKKNLRSMRRRLQIVFQDPYASLNPRMTAAEIITEAWRVYPDLVAPNDRKRELRSLLNQVGLRESDAPRYPKEFSGGQRQRIAIARALAVNPSLIVLDEPVSALDCSIQAQILNLLADIRDAYGVAYVFISHDLSVVRHISDTIGVMFAGRIMEFGPVNAVYSLKLHPYTSDLLAAVPKLLTEKRDSSAVNRPKTQTSLRVISGSHCPYVGRCALESEICGLERPDLTASGSDSSHSVACFARLNDPRYGEQGRAS